MFKARAKLTAQLWDVVEHMVPSGTLHKGVVVDVIRRHPKRDHVVVLHEGEVHAVYKDHLEMVQA
jgi:hypothetical protein